MTRDELKRSRVRTVDVAAILALGAAVGALFLPCAARAFARASARSRVRELSLGRDCAPWRVSRDALLGVRPSGSELVTWGNVGGCGVGGTGGGGGIRWIGRRSGGAPVEVELLANVSRGEDLTSTSTSLKVTGDVPGRFNLGVQVPYVDNTRHVDDFWGGEADLSVSGLGDASLLISRKFGLEGRTSASLTLGIPTGEHDVQIQSYTLPYDAQPGKGVFTASLTVEQSLNRDWGPIIIGGGYNYGGGENDIENYRADSLTGYCYVGYRTERLVHSVGANVSIALGKDRNLGNEIEDQGAFLLSLQYGVEVTLTYRVPAFFAVMATLGEKSSQNSAALALGVMTFF